MEGEGEGVAVPPKDHLPWPAGVWRNASHSFEAAVDMDAEGGCRLLAGEADITDSNNIQQLSGTSAASAGAGIKLSIAPPLEKNAIHVVA